MCVSGCFLEGTLSGLVLKGNQPSPLQKELLRFFGGFGAEATLLHQ